MTISFDGTVGANVGNATVFTAIGNNYLYTGNSTTNVTANSLGLYVGNSAVNSTCFSYNNSSLAPLEAMAYLNMVVNPNIIITQGGNSAVTANSVYINADQWGQGFTGTMAISTWPETEAPNGYSSSLKHKITTADASVAAGDYVVIYQPIEGYSIARLGWGTAGAVNATLGFWAKASVAGNYGIAIKNAALAQSWVASFACTTSWSWFTFSVPARTTGTWPSDNSIGAYLQFAVMAGSTSLAAAGWAAGNFSGVTGSQDNLAATLNATFQVTGVILLAGDHTIASTQARYIQRHLDYEFRLCQRYYEIGYQSGPTNNEGLFNAGGVASGTVRFTTPKRGTVTLACFDSALAANKFNSGMNLTGSTGQTVTAGSLATTSGPYEFYYDFGARAALRHVGLSFGPQTQECKRM